MTGPTVRFQMAGGGWVFSIDTVRFVAIRNEAGFAHRNWDLYRLTDGRIVADQLGTRRECVEAALNLMRKGTVSA